MRGVLPHRRNQDRELPEVLSGGGEVEFVPSPIRTA
jgi:hypothetical protein